MTNDELSKMAASVLQHHNAEFCLCCGEKGPCSVRQLIGLQADEIARLGVESELGWATVRTRDIQVKHLAYHVAAAQGFLQNMGVAIKPEYPMSEDPVDG